MGDGGGHDSEAFGHLPTRHASVPKGSDLSDLISRKRTPSGTALQSHVPAVVGSAAQEKVVGSNTQRRVAVVADAESRRDRSVGQLPGDTVNALDDTTDRDEAIALRLRTPPEPAGVRAIDFRPKVLHIEATYFDTRSWAVFDAMRGKHPRTKKAVKESAHVPEVKAAADEHGWKPTMTKAEADAWVVAMGSKITKPLFHGTDPGSARTILRGGFLKRPALKNAQEYGQGTYLSLNQRYSLRYAHDNDAGLVETRVAVQNPASVAQTREIIKAVDARKPKKADYPALIRAEAEKRGFDALRVQDFFKESMFGSAPEQPVTNLVVFDPKKIVAVSA